MDALIGHSGFVGEALKLQHNFDAMFNTKNSEQIRDLAFDTVVCAAAPGSMFLANRAPKSDREQIDALIDSLSAVRTRRFVLVSSIAVLEDFACGYDEGTTAFQHELAYGRHRRALEAFVENAFEESLVVRLPALFGQGLRKNYMFDLLNPIPTMLTEEKLKALSAVMERRLYEQLSGLYAPDKATGMLKLDRVALDTNPMRSSCDEAAITHGFAATQFHNPETTYQYYNINRLWSDIAVALHARLSHIHLVSEPLKASRIYRRLIGRDMPESDARIHCEDMRTRHAELWGVQGSYLVDGAAVLDQLDSFYASGRRIP